MLTNRRNLRAVSIKLYLIILIWFSSDEALTALQYKISILVKHQDLIDVNRKCGSELGNTLCLIFNKSLRLGKLPSEWKQANITPVFKKESKTLVSKYRPISLLLR